MIQRVVLICVAMVLSACATDRMKGEASPDMAPLRPATDVTVTESGDLICVTENNDPTSRTCVPRVHEKDSQQ